MRKQEALGYQLKCQSLKSQRRPDEDDQNQGIHQGCQLHQYEIKDSDKQN